ncbi:MAG: nucleoside deaminase [Alphaproteobacteria bacterium]|nr:nucleoside deaminase [Alphaproteobacteria bacterium]
MAPLFSDPASISPGLLEAIAHMPTTSLPVLVSTELQAALSDAAVMRIAVHLAAKSRSEGGCPIGAVVRRDADGVIVGKGHNTLVQEGHPYNHGETSAMRDAGRVDYSRTTLYTTLSPCDVCTALLHMRGVRRVVVGNVRSVQASADQNLAILRAQGVEVEVLEDEEGVALYERYQDAHPDLDLEDWKGLAAVRNG